MAVIKRHVSFQPTTHAAVEAECEETGLPFATQLDQMLRDVIKARRALLVGEALKDGLITQQEAADRMSELAAGD